MSAYIVTDNTINAIITWAFTNKVWVNGAYVTGNEQNLAAMLFKANVDSVNYRYEENTADDSFEYAPYTKTLSIVNMASLLAHFEYQACEVEDWENTEACRFINTLRKALLSTLPGYDIAPWGLPE